MANSSWSQNVQEVWPSNDGMVLLQLGQMVFFIDFGDLKVGLHLHAVAIVHYFSSESQPSGRASMTSLLMGYSLA